MGIPVSQQAAIAKYIIGKKLKGEKRYPLTLMLEPLFQCNLECPGCGKIDYESHILKQRLSVEECMRAVDECGAPVVSVAGGEPLVHKDIKAIVDGFLARGKFIYLCTNAILLESKLDLFTPSDHFTFSVHLDGMRERHDESVGREGVFDTAVAAIREAKRRGFRVNINTTLFTTANPQEVADFFDFATNDLKVDGITASPGYHYDHAPNQDVFLGRTQSKELFRGIFKIKKDRSSKWPMSHSGLFLDFVCGNQTYQCTPWSMPCRNVFGWQKPCYLLVDEGYEPTFKALMENTDWDHYGVGRNPKCANCMAHCGFEGTAAEDSASHPLKAALAALRGPKLEGPFAPELPLMYDPAEFKRGQVSTITSVPLSSITGGASCARPKAELVNAD
ncbi:MAG: adenosyl-hopene transferase HpnH [Nevskiaceae bacterium]|nr:MAG: adenosyl-hopene transferase HpnH [Nevskiaceae bacterium]TBR71820.1 MAG: adenosyl-hopene transferase HpnH [Nevskiaceae bacterium]